MMLWDPAGWIKSRDSSRNEDAFHFNAATATSPAAKASVCNFFSSSISMTTKS